MPEKTGKPILVYQESLIQEVIRNSKHRYIAEISAVFNGIKTDNNGKPVISISLIPVISTYTRWGTLQGKEDFIRLHEIPVIEVGLFVDGNGIYKKEQGTEKEELERVLKRISLFQAQEAVKTAQKTEPNINITTALQKRYELINKIFEETEIKIETGKSYLVIRMINDICNALNKGILDKINSSDKATNEEKAEYIQECLIPLMRKELINQKTGFIVGRGENDFRKRLETIMKKEAPQFTIQENKSIASVDRKITNAFLEGEKDRNFREHYSEMSKEQQLKFMAERMTAREIMFSSLPLEQQEAELQRYIDDLTRYALSVNSPAEVQDFLTVIAAAHACQETYHRAPHNISLKTTGMFIDVERLDRFRVYADVIVRSEGLETKGKKGERNRAMLREEFKALSGQRYTMVEKVGNRIEETVGGLFTFKSSRFDPDLVPNDGYRGGMVPEVWEFSGLRDINVIPVKGVRGTSYLNISTRVGKYLRGNFRKETTDRLLKPSLMIQIETRQRMNNNLRRKEPLQTISYTASFSEIGFKPYKTVQKRDEDLITLALALKQAGISLTWDKKTITASLTAEVKTEPLSVETELKKIERKIQAIEQRENRKK